MKTQTTLPSLREIGQDHYGKPILVIGSSNVNKLGGHACCITGC